jgi:hypothetical protein
MDFGLLYLAPSNNETVSNVALICRDEEIRQSSPRVLKWPPQRAKNERTKNSGAIAGVARRDG